MKRIHEFARFAVVIIAVITAPGLAAQNSSVTSGTSPDVVIRTGDTTTSTLKVFNSANTELLKLTATGSLDVSGPVRSAPESGSFSVGGTAPTRYQFYSSQSAAGYGAAMQLNSNYNLYSTSFIANLGWWGTHISHNREPQLGGFTHAAAAPNQWKAVDLALGEFSNNRDRMFAVSNFPGGTPALRLVIRASTGNVGIGSDVEQIMTDNPTKRLVVSGDIYVSGNINAKYQDVAEWVRSKSDLEPGTVVVLDPVIGDGVMASSVAYDTAVAGVVSARPGLVLGDEASGKEQVATTGRVRVRVDAASSSIRVGDLLVTSDKPGMAMRSEPTDIGGRNFHQPGTIIGKALEPLENGEGEILVLLSLQ